jgi:hypothetical protein
LVRGVLRNLQHAAEKVGEHVLSMRRRGIIKYDDITDTSRRFLKRRSFVNPVAALEYAAENDRKDFWHDRDVLAQVWTEKDAISATLWEKAWDYDIGLQVARGHASETVVYEAAKLFNETPDKEVCVFYFGDLDVAGALMTDNLESKLRGFAPGVRIHFKRMAVNREQIEELGLPTVPGPLKGHPKLVRQFIRKRGRRACEIDAVPPDVMRGLLEDELQKLMPPEKLEELQAQEEAERHQIRTLVEIMKNPAMTEILENPQLAEAMKDPNLIEVLKAGMRRTTSRPGAVR